MNENEKKDILEKVRKVLAKSKNNPSEAESQAAILKAQEILIKYGLSMEQIKGLNNDDIEVYEKKSGLLKSTWWHKSLALNISENFKCKCYLNGNELTFIGLSEDVEICCEIFQYAKENINYNCNLFMQKKKHRLRIITKEKISNAKKSYITGYLYGLKEKLKKQVDDNKWEIIICTPIEVENYFNSFNFTHTTSIEGFNNSDKVALREGYKAGKNFELIIGNLE